MKGDFALGWTDRQTDICDCRIAFATGYLVARGLNYELLQCSSTGTRGQTSSVLQPRTFILQTT